MATLDVAVVQMEVCSGEVRKNCVRAEARIIEAARHGAQAILLPELWTTGYNWPAMPALAEPRDGETVGWLTRLAARCNVSLVAGSIAERRDGAIYNTSYLIAPDGGVLGSYSKRATLPAARRAALHGGGRGSLQAIDTAHGRWGQLICFDIRFPELARAASRWPAPASSGSPPSGRIRGWNTGAPCCAPAHIEDQMFVVAANRCGQGDGVMWCGHSRSSIPGA